MVRVGRVPRVGAGLALVALLTATGCAVGAGGDPDARVLTVFAAASLAEPFTRIAEQLEQAEPDLRVRLSFDGSSGLLDQIAGGAPADVFASADARTMDRAAAQGLTAGSPTGFATNTLTLITPPGNPAGITGLDDSLADARLVMCARAVPCGAGAHDLAGAAGVALRPVSEESSVTDVRGKVTSGEADAGIVYATDAAAAGAAVRRIPVAGAERSPNHYSVAVLTGAADPAAAQSFVAAVTGPTGRAALADAGFGPP